MHDIFYLLKLTFYSWLFLWIRRWKCTLLWRFFSYMRLKSGSQVDRSTTVGWQLKFRFSPIKKNLHLIITFMHFKNFQPCVEYHILCDIHSMNITHITYHITYHAVAAHHFVRSECLFALMQLKLIELNLYSIS